MIDKLTLKKLFKHLRELYWLKILYLNYGKIITLQRENLSFQMRLVLINDKVSIQQKTLAKEVNERVLYLKITR